MASPTSIRRSEQTETLPLLAITRRSGEHAYKPHIATRATHLESNSPDVDALDSWGVAIERINAHPEANKVLRNATHRQQVGKLIIDSSTHKPITWTLGDSFM
jgi:plasmid replication initiation protein